MTAAQLALPGVTPQRLGQISTAVFSEDRRYRYRLVRVWNTSRPVLSIVMLNGSIADEHSDDPTISRWETRANWLGFGGLIVRNVYGAVSTDPRKLRAMQDPVGPANDQELALATHWPVTVLGWGTHAQPERIADVMAILLAGCRARGSALAVLGWTKYGQPRHPLYMPVKTALQRYLPAAPVGDIDERWQHLVAAASVVDNAPMVTPGSPALTRSDDSLPAVLRRAQHHLHVRGWQQRGRRDPVAIDVVDALAAARGIAATACRDALVDELAVLKAAIPAGVRLGSLPAGAPDPLLDPVLIYQDSLSGPGEVHDWMRRAVLAASQTERAIA
ncbi:DUF1643 domain-containing protein [Mycobacteroides abscessus]|uniref:DUF1643 domain-containing protein n=1 Tax=Mycobacteroides abscessus TaxID=36809 RepID=UPI00210737E3|nr:DUF1643 domain-containing protein [Mycobacteroides abscessus]